MTSIGLVLGLILACTPMAVAQTTIIDVNPGPTGSDPTEYVSFNGYVYFAADDGVNGRELWRSDGLSAALVMDINPGSTLGIPNSSSPQWLTVVGSTLFFGADDGVNGRELWKTDGTTTALVADIAPGAPGSDPQWLTSFNNEVFFSADNGPLPMYVGRELWKSNGTGAALVKDIFPGGIGVLGITNSGQPEELTVVNGELFFRATSANGVELWKSNGSIGNAVEVKDIYPGTSGLPPQANSSFPNNLTDVAGTLFFAATTTAGAELWESDGTMGGTMMAADINPGPGSSTPDNLYVSPALGLLLFSANDGTNGVELWISPGAGGGAALVSNIRPGSASSLPKGFTQHAGLVYFSANDGTNGTELWVTDGSAGNTSLVANIRPGGFGSNPQQLTSISGVCGNGIVFQADDGTDGKEFWSSDGSGAGTVLVQDINPGAASSSPTLFTELGGLVLFRADDGVSGFELAVVASSVFGDTTPPMITCGMDQTVSADASCMGMVPDFISGATATDNCGAVTVTQSPAIGTLVPLGPTTVTLTATDGAANTATCTNTLMVNDTTPPSITCPAGQTLPADATCQALVPDFTAGATATDNCSSPTLSQSPAAGTLVGLGMTTVTVTATDAASNSANCTVVLTVADQTAPVLTCPLPITLNADATCGALIPDVTALTTAVENCSTATLTQLPLAGTPVILGTTTVVVTGTDAAGNSSTCNAMVSVVDGTPPTVTCPANQSASADASCMAPVPDFTSGATAADNCGAPTLTQTPAAGTLVGIGITTVTVTATDGAGLMATCTADFTVDDTTPPTITCAGNQTVSADASCMAPVPDFMATATAADNCGTPALSQSPAAGTLVGLGTITVTVTATDGAGLIATCTADLTVDDTTPPTITCPGNLIASADASCMGLIPDFTATAIAADNCGTPTVTQTPAAGTVVGLGTTTVTVSAADAAGLMASCTVDFTLNDTTPPTVTCPANQSASADASCMAPVPDFTSGATAADNCGAPTLTQAPAAGTLVGIGVTTVTVTATDGAGLTATCTADLTVDDTTPPTITCGGNQTVAADASCMAPVPDFMATATAADNCGTPALTQAPAAGTLVGLGTVTVTVTATDGAGLIATCTADFTVDDTTPPTITCPGPISVPADPGTCTATGVALGTPVTADNCGVATTSNDAPGTFPAGTTTVNWTVVDNAGLTATCTQDVTVMASLPVVTDPTPVITCEGTAATFNVSASGTGPFTYQWLKDGLAIPGATLQLLLISPVALTDAGNYSCTVSDPCGSVTSGAASLTVDPLPVITMQPASLVGCLGGSATFSVTAMGAGLTYQWQKDTVALPGETGSILILSSLNAGDAGSYDVVVTGTCGSVMSDPAYLQILGPVGEDPCSAIQILGSGAYAGNTTCVFPQSVLLPTCGDPANHLSNDMWFYFKAGCDGSATASTCPYNSVGLATFDTHLSVWSGPDFSALACPFSAASGTFAEVACNDDELGCGTASTVSWGATTGQTYYIRVAGKDLTQHGPFVMGFDYDSGLVLTMAQPTGTGSFTLTNTGGQPGYLYFTAITADTANAPPNFGTGWWFGLNISYLEIDYLINWPLGEPFYGFLDAAGSSFWDAVAANNNTPLPPLNGIHIYGVTAIFDPATNYFLACNSALVDSGPLQ